MMALVYSCCFWFSLRLGGILIGIISLLQAIFFLTACCVAYNHTQQVKDKIIFWITILNLLYAKDYLENIKEDAENYIALGISLTCIYMIICLLYIYGAYLRNNILMICFILVELLRLIVLSILVVTSLFVLKQNTMDIGLLIGASVVGGFILLGMFYLWLCTANLPILINEMQRDEQAATIDKLKQLLETNNQRTMIHGLDNIPYTINSSDTNSRNVLPRTQGIPHDMTLVYRSKLSIYNP